MKLITGESFYAERALYGSECVRLADCSFDGPADGESALKESKNVRAERCYFNLRYPFWHDHAITLSDCELTPLCRAALWYSDHITISGTKLHGIKALRECHDVDISGSDIISPEFGWSVNNINMSDSTAESDYFMLRSEDLNFKNVRMKGKYSFQYIRDSVFEDCVFDTKDAFWHSKNVTARNCTINGEYLAWYSDHLTLEHCRISGTQPLCYCTNLRLIDCEMTGADFCFEKSDVAARINTPVISIKNPRSGRIVVPAVGEIIRDEDDAKGEVVVCKCAAKPA